MDSLTQIALGSAVGYAVLGNKVGRKAALYGAVFGTLPDLDVFISFGGPVENFTYHRSFSHSLLVQLLISPLIAWLLVKAHPATKIHRTDWFWLVFLTLSTHALLDNFTVYGTQLLWPLTDFPFAVSSMFIIDPIYTLPLLLGLLAFCIPKVSHIRLHRINTLALTLSSIYLSWSLLAKWYVDRTIQTALSDRGISKNIYESTPAPLTTFLWRAVVVDDDQYYEIYTSIFDNSSQVSIDAYPTSPFLLETISNEWGVKRLQFFTKGLYSIKQEVDRIILSDLRMGLEGSYVFTFEVGRQGELGIVASDYVQIENRPNVSQVGLLWDRIWDHEVSLTPASRGIKSNPE
jgi:inner membrane protein